MTLAREDRAVVPTALGVAAGQFVALEPHAQLAEPAELPSECPARLPMGAPGDSDTDRDELAPITVFLTVDTEDTYFTVPRLITGEGIGPEYGVSGILDALDERRVTATFFVNVFEADRQPPGAVRNVVAEIDRRGHEVGLHTHPAPELPWYDRPLFRKTLDEQREILTRGRATLQDWSGQAVTAFRAGGYAINDDTLLALPAAGLRVDSSVFFASANNHNSRFAVNAPRLAGELIEAPVTYVIRRDEAGGRLEHRKLDPDWLSIEQMLAAIGELRSAKVPTAVMMMHSFSFLDKASLPPEQPRSDRARFTSEVLFNRYVEIYGPKPDARRTFEALLDLLTANPGIRVCSLDDGDSDLRAAVARRVPDVVPVVQR